MRPQKAHSIVRNALKLFYVHGFDDFSSLKTKVVLSALEKLIEKDRLDNLRIDGQYDDRSVEEIYPDLTHQKIISELHYISDRFNATHRLRFLHYVATN